MRKVRRLCYAAQRYHRLACNINGVHGLWTAARGDRRRAWPQFRLHVTFLVAGRLNTITSRGSKGCLLRWLYQWLFLTCSLHASGKTLFLLSVLFSLSASKKSNNTRKYHLLIKRNPLYFLGAFFHLLGKLGLPPTKVLYFRKVENTNFSFTRVSRC